MKLSEATCARVAKKEMVILWKWIADLTWFGFLLGANEQSLSCVCVWLCLCLWMFVVVCFLMRSLLKISLSQTSINKIAWVSYEIEKVTSGCTMGFDSAYYLWNRTVTSLHHKAVQAAVLHPCFSHSNHLLPSTRVHPHPSSMGSDVPVLANLQGWSIYHWKWRLTSRYPKA